MSPFKSDKQRRKYFVMNKSLPSPSPQPPYMGISKNSIIENPISDALIWTGCTFAFPNECLVIKGVSKAYKIYKQDIRYNRYDNTVENIVKSGLPKIISTIAENEIHTVSEEIVNQVNDSGLITNMSENTKINGNIIRDIMVGTVSNLLKDQIEDGTGFLVNNVIL